MCYTFLDKVIFVQVDLIWHMAAWKVVVIDSTTRYFCPKIDQNEIKRSTNFTPTDHWEEHLIMLHQDQNLHNSNVVEQDLKGCSEQCHNDILCCTFEWSGREKMCNLHRSSDPFKIWRQNLILSKFDLKISLFQYLISKPDFTLCFGLLNSKM